MTPDDLEELVEEACEEQDRAVRQAIGKKERDSSEEICRPRAAARIEVRR